MSEDYAQLLHRGSGGSMYTRKLGNLATPKRVQELQMALHAKAKAEADYRFYALYDKISREDILIHAFAQCRSNKGAPGIDGQDFADVETYGVERWLGELALALRQETYRPAPIRRVFIPKANGKLKPIYRQNSTPTGLGEMPNRRWSRWKNGCSEATWKSLTPTSRTTSGAFHTPTC